MDFLQAQVAPKEFLVYDLHWLAVKESSEMTLDLVGGSKHSPTLGAKQHTVESMNVKYGSERAFWPPP